MNAKQHERMRTGKGFIAALDQSGGSTPKALKLYGIDESKYKGEDQMFDMIHQARSRLITSPSFTSDGVLAAILFEQTMDREISGKPTATYLWEDKGIVPILKVDKGLADAADGVQLMKPVPDLDKLLKRAVEKGIYGIKERSVIKEPNKAGIKATRLGNRCIVDRAVPRRSNDSIPSLPTDTGARTAVSVEPSAETAGMLFWALLAWGQINMRKVDGWQTLATAPIAQPIDLAA